MSTSGQRSVLVVGGGIIGIACAHYLTRAGRSVTVIDQGSLAGACSHGNCGYICPSHVLPLTEPGMVRMGLRSLFQPNAPFRIKPRLSPALANWLFQFARRCTHRQMLAAAVHLKAILDSSMREYRELETAGLDCEWNDVGLLYVLKHEAALDRFAAQDRLITDEFAVSARRIEGADLQAFDPALKSGLAGGFLYENDASLRPDLLARNWVRQLKAQGVLFWENCPMEGLRKEQGRIVALQTPLGDMEADDLVFATGAWTATLSRELECRIPIQPGKGYSLTMARPDPCPRVSMLFPEHKVGVTPFQQGYRLGSMMEFAGYDSTIPPHRIQQLRNSAEPYLTNPWSDVVEEEWYGWRPMTWDSLPIIGRTPRLANTWLATGHNMVGLSLAPATGRLLAELMDEETPHIDPVGFSPNRF